MTSPQDGTSPTEPAALRADGQRSRAEADRETRAAARAALHIALPCAAVVLALAPAVLLRT
ncbi:hypothetical protein [Streptomyces bohaiensis]|uniref:hypothetical protein n=1 Tax=Streptomyces bohaiensis TaxID=1431344 RepID=UPI003B816B08